MSELTRKAWEKNTMGIIGAVTHYEKAADYYTDMQPVEPWGSKRNSIMRIGPSPHL